MPAASEPIAVNTGPLIALAASDDLDLLRQLHARVLVPQAVVDEYGRGVHRAPGVRPRLDRMRAAGVWISDRLLDAVLAEAGERG
jgi:predicted nucleic acid-binding protein